MVLVPNERCAGASFLASCLIRLVASAYGGMHQTLLTASSAVTAQFWSAADTWVAPSRTARRRP